MYGIGIWGLSPHSLEKILPNVLKIKKFNFIGFLTRSKNNSLTENLPYKLFIDEEEFLNDSNMNIVIIATPPALHYKNAKAALLNRKNIIVEKPITINLEDTENLILLAQKLNLFMIEAYYYKIHEQYNTIKSIFLNYKNKPLSIISRFGIPKVNRKSFRDKKFLGASVFWDVGCYPISIVSDFFDLDNLTINFTNVNTPLNSDVDIDGVTFISTKYNQKILLEWNMGYSYQNSIEIWSDQFYIKSDYIFSKPQNIKINIEKSNKHGTKNLQSIKNNNCIHLFYENVANNFLKQTFKNTCLFEINKLAKLQNQILLSSNKIKKNIS